MPKRPSVPARTFVVTSVFYVLTTFVDAGLMFAPHLVGAALALQALTPLPALSYRLLGGAAARWASRLRVWDVLRSEQGVTYAAPGEPGAFGGDAAKRYIFCYQPMGVQARGAWYTFAGKGEKSPVSRLRGVKLAVGRWLWLAPGAQQMLALYDCCDSGYATLKALLTDKVGRSLCGCVWVVGWGGGVELGQAEGWEVWIVHGWQVGGRRPGSRATLVQPAWVHSARRPPAPASDRLPPAPWRRPPPPQEPKSVCLTPGGFREAKYLGTYKAALHCRRGFCRLALETRAALVPVIGVGEPCFAGAPIFAGRITKLLAP